MTANGWLLLGSIIAAAITAWSAVRVARSGRDANRETLRAAPYEQLSARVATLEGQVEKMRVIQWDTDNDLDATVDALWEQQRWIEAGATPPPPDITARALQAMHRRRAKRAETRRSPHPDQEGT